MIHPTAIIHESAKLGAGVSVGAYSIIGEHVEVGANTWIGPHVVVTGHTRIGADNRIFQFSSIGEQPQDKKYAGEVTYLEIGDRNTIREFCTLNCGTSQDGGVTRVGSDNWIMAYVHIAHDCQLGNQIVLANSVNLAGHVHVGDWAILGGYTGVHQFCRVGAHAFCGGGTILLQDLPPYVMAAGDPCKTHGINSEGLKRRGFSSPAIMAIKRAYKALYRQGLSLDEARAQISAAVGETPELQLLLDFISVPGRGFVR